jgi:hypothetical protein
MEMAAEMGCYVDIPLDGKLCTWKGDATSMTVCIPSGMSTNHRNVWSNLTEINMDFEMLTTINLKT